MQSTKLYPPKFNTFICPIIRTDLIERCLETVYKYTEPGSFYFYIIDQSAQGVDATKLRNKYKNLMVIRTPKSDVHYTGNLGFAQGTNLGVSLVQTPYFTMINDDVELLNKKWWQGILDTFEQVLEATPDNPAMIVNCASVRLADWSVGREAGDDFDILSYKKEYTEEDWRHLVEDQHYINEHLTLQPDSVIDGVTCYCSVVDTVKFNEVGRLCEKYYVGGGEDYDLSCRARMFGYRCVATTKSWCWHWWSSSFKSVRDEEEAKALIVKELSWNQNHEKWGAGFDIWGYCCPKCKEIMQTKDGITATCPKDGETYQMPETVTMPL